MSSNEMPTKSRRQQQKRHQIIQPYTKQPLSITASPPLTTQSLQIQAHAAAAPTPPFQQQQLYQSAQTDTPQPMQTNLQQSSYPDTSRLTQAQQQLTPPPSSLYPNIQVLSNEHLNSLQRGQATKYPRFQEAINTKKQFSNLEKNYGFDNDKRDNNPDANTNPKKPMGKYLIPTAIFVCLVTTLILVCISTMSVMWKVISSFILLITMFLTYYYLKTTGTITPKTKATTPIKQTKAD